MNGKSRNLQKLQRNLTRIVISRFKVGTACCGGRGGWFSSGFCGGAGRGGLSGVSATIFVFYLNNLPYEALPSTSSISPLL